MHTHYPIVIHKDPDSDYCVTVPDLPRLHNRRGIRLMMHKIKPPEAIQCHIEGMLLYGESIPQPRDIAFHQYNPGLR